MNDDDSPQAGDDFLSDVRADARLGLRVALSLLPAAIAPLIGPAILKASREQFDLYELTSFLFIPILYFVLGAYVCSRRSSFFQHLSARPDVRRPLAAYKLTYMVALLLLCFYQALITLVLSPGGPEQAKGTFWLWTAVFYPPYIALMVTSELYIRRAFRLVRRVQLEAGVDRAENG